MTALDVASVNDFQHLCAVINLMGPPPTVMQDEIIAVSKGVNCWNNNYRSWYALVVSM